MNEEFNFETDPFQAFAEYGGVFQESAAGWQSEVSRTSAEYIRWVQTSLNRIMRLQLAVDGIKGPKTTSAVRSFQQQSRLVVDGIVGPKTEAALIAAGAEPPPGSSPVPAAPRPLGPNELLQFIKPREPLKSAANVPIQLNLALPAIALPQLSLAKADAALPQLGSIGLNQVKIVVQRALGQLALPPSIPVSSITQVSSAPSATSSQAGFVPEHLALRPLPQALPYHLKAKSRIHFDLPAARPKELYEPTTRFLPDDRRVFQDTSYPWGTAGLVETPGAAFSGVMVGPRHMLTCSHGIHWNSDGTTGWVKFTPGSFDGSAPLGNALGIRVYFMKKVFGPTVDTDEARSDYVVVVLNSRIGDVTGWMGSRSYSDSWDNEPFWGHIGYPADLHSGTRPTFQASISLDGAFFDSNSRKRIFHKGDVWPGQSGGPFFGWWRGESYPTVVAVQSAQNPSENIASGGSELLALVSKARAEFP